MVPTRPRRLPLLHSTSTQMLLRMPFDDQLDYTSFSINIPPTAIGSMRETLLAVAANRTRLRGMQRALWEARAALDWTDLSERGTFYRVVERLARRVAY